MPVNDVRPSGEWRVASRRWYLIIAAIFLLTPFEASGLLSQRTSQISIHPGQGRREIYLHMQGNATQDSHSRSPLQLSFTVQLGDKRQIACDLLAVIIACQLMGLLDAVNDSEFSRNGGWLQPIPAIPSTLGSFIQRVGLLSCIWLPLSTIHVGSPNDSAKHHHDWISGIWYRLLFFSLIRWGVALAMVNYFGQDIDVLETFRDCYLVGLTTTTFRLLYRQYFG